LGGTARWPLVPNRDERYIYILKSIADSKLSIVLVIAFGYRP